MSAQTLLEEHTSSENAKMLGDSGYTYDEGIELLALPDFEELKELAYNYILKADSFLMVEKMQTEVFVNKSDRMDKKWIRLWIQWILFFVKNDRIELGLKNKVALQSVLVEAMDVLPRPVDLGLFMDKLYFDIRKAVME